MSCYNIQQLCAKERAGNQTIIFEYGRSDVRQYENIAWKNIITEDCITLSFSAGLTCSTRGPPTITTPAEWALNQLHN